MSRVIFGAVIGFILGVAVAAPNSSFEPQRNPVAPPQVIALPCPDHSPQLDRIEHEQQLQKLQQMWERDGVEP